MSANINVRFPPGRLVDGDLYDPQTTDAEGKPLLVKSGPNAGKPTQKYFFGVAVKKTAGHWGSEAWGSAIWALGHSSWPQGQAQAPGFAWKIVDGDSQIPNKKGRKPCDREGYPGNWVVHFSSGFAPKVCNADGSAYLLEKDYVKLGYFVEVYATVVSNESPNQPGMFINHNAVSFQGFGPVIVQGIDPRTLGFGKSPLPAGASAVPVGGTAAPAVPAAPLPTGAPPPVPGAVAAAVVPPMPLPAPVAVAPAPSFLTPPAPPTAAPPPPAAHVMLPAAGGISYDAYRASGWSDEQLRTAGKMA